MREAVICLGVLLCACGPGPRGSGDDVGANDDDGDGYTVEAGDCNDNNPSINPGATEVCTDGVDNDCNGQIDGNDYNCMTPCERAAYDRSSVGCVYYAVDTNPLGGPFAVAVSNVGASVPANVTIEVKTGNVWTVVPMGTFTVAPKSLQTVNLTRRFAEGTRINVGGAYRITSDLPVISYQFAPIDGSSSFLSDASLLLPVSALDKYYIVSAWPYGADIGNTPRPARLQIAATEATTVTVTSPIASENGQGVATLQPNTPATYQLQEGDFLQLTVASLNQSFTGTYIEADKPVAVFSSNDCANVPNIPSVCCCDHLEEQLFGLQTWGKSYVGAQMPRRGTESSIWQILAQQDGTNVTFMPSAGVTGLPPSVTLAARQMVEYEVRGGATPGDFFVQADKPILVNQFTVGSFHVQANSDQGDPDMVQAVPVEQFLTAYTILVPGTWINDYIVITRKAGTMVLVDGVPPNAAWNPVPGGWETGVISVPDGVHTLESNTPFGVHVSGYDQYDSYAYPGGLNQTVINPIL
jgi:hypothetical protein